MILRGDIILVPGREVPKWKDMNACNMFCKTCALTKARRRSYGDAVNERTDNAFHTIHMDTMGPIETSGVLGVHSLQGGYRGVGEHKYVLTATNTLKNGWANCLMSSRTSQSWGSMGHVFCIARNQLFTRSFSSISRISTRINPINLLDLNVFSVRVVDSPQYARSTL